MNGAFTYEEIVWIQNNFKPDLDFKAFTELFNKHFNSNRPYNSIRSKTNQLGLKTNKLFTEEQKQWLIKNYSANVSVKETTKQFNKVFGTDKRFYSIQRLACELDLHKTNDGRFKKGIHVWCEGLSSEEIMSHYSEEAKAKMKERIYSAPQMKMKRDWEAKNGPVPEGYCLSNLGNGEVMLMNKKIYCMLNSRHELNQGELTKTLYYVYEAKIALDKKTGKRNLLRPFSEERKQKLKEALIESNKKHRRLNDEQVKQLLEDKKTMSDKELAQKYHVSKTTIREYLRKSNYPIRKMNFYTDEKIKKILEMNKTMSFRTISKKLNIPRTTIRDWVKKYNLERRNSYGTTRNHL